jgi:CubicO group peptidase (beta-lactamase class C family)
VLGRVVERITGVDYDEHVRNNILEPLGVSRMQIGSNYLSGRASGEVRYYGSFPYYDHGPDMMKAYDGWIASTLDLVRFITAVDGIETPPDLFGGESRRLMGGPPPWWDGSPEYYGMGWGRSTGRWMHGGGMNGAASWIEMRDDGLAFAVLMNTNSGGDVLPGNVFSWIDAVDDWPDHDLWPQNSNE